MSRVLFSSLPKFDDAEHVVDLSPEDIASNPPRPQIVSRRPARVLQSPAKPAPVEPVDHTLPDAQIADTAVVPSDQDDVAMMDSHAPGSSPPRTDPVVEDPPESATIHDLNEDLNVALDHALLIFETGLDDISDKIAKQANVLALEVMAELLPKLSEQFLAEEVALCLPDLLPPSIAEVELAVSPVIAERLRRIVDDRQSSEVSYHIVPTETLEAGRLEINWKTGGLSSNFEKQLEACLDRLKARSQPEET